MKKRQFQDKRNRSGSKSLPAWLQNETVGAFRKWRCEIKGITVIAFSQWGRENNLRCDKRREELERLSAGGLKVCQVRSSYVIMRVEHFHWLSVQQISPHLAAKGDKCKVIKKYWAKPEVVNRLSVWCCTKLSGGVTAYYTKRLMADCKNNTSSIFKIKPHARQRYIEHQWEIELIPAGLWVFFVQETGNQFMRQTSFGANIHTDVVLGLCLTPFVQHWKLFFFFSQHMLLFQLVVREDFLK